MHLSITAVTGLFMFVLGLLPAAAMASDVDLFDGCVYRTVRATEAEMLIGMNDNGIADRRMLVDDIAGAEDSMATAHKARVTSIGIPVSLGWSHLLGSRIDAGLRLGVVAGSLTVFFNDTWSRHRGSDKLGATLWVFPMNGSYFIDPYISGSFAETASLPVDYVPETCAMLSIGARIQVYGAFAIRPEIGHAWLSSNILSGLSVADRETNTRGEEFFFGLSLECDILKLLFPSIMSR